MMRLLKIFGCSDISLFTKNLWACGLFGLFGFFTKKKNGQKCRIIHHSNDEKKKKNRSLPKMTPNFSSCFGACTKKAPQVFYEELDRALSVVVGTTNGVYRDRQAGRQHCTARSNS
jgi:hypothetical protein